VLCVLYSKDKRHNQDKEVVQMKCREQKENPTGSVDVFLSLVSAGCHEVEVSATSRSLDHSSGGILPTVVCHCVFSRNLTNRRS
jgi:hypothetical protein